MNNILELENKYIDLLLKRCLGVEKTKILMINVSLEENLPFAEKVKEKASELGVSDIYINFEDMEKFHDYLKNTDLEDIKLNKIIDRSIWDEYAKKGASMLFLDTEVPGLMKDIESSKIAKAIDIRNQTRPYYMDNATKFAFPWTIAAIPNKRWAEIIFPNDENSYEKLYTEILKMCMVDKADPIKAWEEFTIKNNEKKDILNNLEIKKLHYKNSLGTDLHISLPENVIWMNVSDDKKDDLEMMVNIPSYEIFTSPDYRMTEGIVYSSRPLINEGNVIDKFYLEFKDGKVVNYGAEKGEEYLRALIEEHENSNVLGEVALVEYSSPISETGIVFYTTLFDENASCHLALGDSFETSIKDGVNMSKDERMEKGLNSSKIHVDFMVGTKDLEIVAETNRGQVKIFENGNFCI